MIYPVLAPLTGSKAAWRILRKGIQIGTLVQSRLHTPTRPRYNVNLVLGKRLISADIIGEPHTLPPHPFVYSLKIAGEKTTRYRYKRVINAIAKLMQGWDPMEELTTGQRAIIAKAARGELIAYNSKQDGIVYKGASASIVCWLLDIGALVNPYAKRKRWQCVKLEPASGREPAKARV